MSIFGSILIRFRVHFRSIFKTLFWFIYIFVEGNLHLFCNLKGCMKSSNQHLHDALSISNITVLYHVIFLVYFRTISINIWSIRIIRSFSYPMHFKTIIKGFIFVNFRMILGPFRVHFR